ncbi:MAG TPA: tetratricopeptide repeat protein [Candidatus Baltobacteraceae bacterium]
MKRILLTASFVAAFCGGLALSAAPASAGLFGGGAKATASPSPTPLPMPTATPEPPNIAIPRLEQRLKNNPNDRQAMTDLATEFLGIGHPEAAVTLTQQLLRLGTKTGQVYYLDGSAQESLGNLNAALADFEQASDLEPTNLSVLASLADLYVKANRMQDAERVALRGVTFNKDEPRAYVNLGIVYASEQKWDDARKQFEAAYALDPKDVMPLMQEAQTWVMQNTIPNALAVIDRAIAADPKNVQVLIFRADLYAKQHDVTRAASAYDDAVAAATTDPEKASVMVRKALMYAQLKKASEAQATFDAAIKQYPLIGSLHTAYGEFFLAQHDQRRAEQQFLTAIKADKTDVNALMDMAQLKSAQGRSLDAIGYLKQITEVAPSAQSFALLGQAYVSTHDYGKAKDACSKSFQISRTPDTLGCIAGSDYQLKNYKEAAAIFDILNGQIKQYMDRNPQMLYMAGVAYTHTNQKPKAIDSYKRLLKIMKPGTKSYKQIQSQIASLSKSSAAKKGKHA